jgi:hypothetical protein
MLTYLRYKAAPLGFVALPLTTAAPPFIFCERSFT